MRIGANSGFSLLVLHGISEREDPLLRNETQIVEVEINVELETGVGDTFGSPVPHGLLRYSDDPGSGGDVIIPVASENVRLLFVSASDPVIFFKPLWHRRKMADFSPGIKAETNSKLRPYGNY